MGLALPDSHVGSVDSDDVSDSVDDGEVLESLGVDHDLGELVGLGLGVEGGVNDLENADISILLYLVGESGINNNSVEVVVLIGGGEGSLAQLSVLVLEGERLEWARGVKLPCGWSWRETWVWMVWIF